MRITRKQLRSIIREAIEVLDVDNGYVLTFGDGPEDAAPDSAVPELFKRLDIQYVRNGPRDYAVREDDWQALEDETKGKRMARRATRRRDRLKIDNLMDRLEDWAVTAREEYLADNPGTDMQGVAMDLARGAEYSFEPDEWDELLTVGPFDYPDDLYTYVADLIA